MSVRDFLRWAWNPPASKMITGHPYHRESWAWGDWCTQVPGHFPGGTCPAPGHCQHNACGQPRRYHTLAGVASGEG